MERCSSLVTEVQRQLKPQLLSRAFPPQARPWTSYHDLRECVKILTTLG